MCVDRIALKMVWECPQKELIDHTFHINTCSHGSDKANTPSLLYSQIILDLTIPPSCEVLRVIINSVEPVAPDKCYCV